MVIGLQFCYHSLRISFTSIMLEVENIERQNEEIDILKAIFNEDGEQCVVSKVSQGCNIVEIKLSDYVTIKATLPTTYPSIDGPIFELVGRNIKEQDRMDAIGHFVGIYQLSENDVVLFSCVEWARENMKILHQPEQEDLEDGPVVALEGMEEMIANSEELASKIYHSEPVVDRKSVFQAHVAPVTSVQEALEVLSVIKQDRKVSRATHNIMAYRITIVNPEDVFGDTTTVYADNDDDGEHAAGPKLAELLSLMGANNLIVVVSRWYGGIQLGPDRFKHIANVARESVEHCGLCARSVNKKGGGGTNTTTGGTSRSSSKKSSVKSK